MASSARKPAAKKPKRLDLVSIARWVSDQSVLFDPADGSPFVATVTEGDPRLVLITGENASGKSLLYRVMASKITKAGATAVSLSIRERTGSGAAGGIGRVMMFGDEQEQSTGATTIRTLQNAFERNLDREAGCTLGLDEPELGLSESYAIALGRYIGEQTKSIPAACSGVIVVTHSRPLVRALVDAYGKTPTHVSVGAGAPAGIDTWLETPEERTIDDLLALPETGHQRWLWANKYLSPR